ncbi:hypothetical protein FHX82_002687 [Amycolatopsis bartoniae]|uniref:Uncharacterized protein n=1 Tax=Amycolatopsis bartoniae TaxID=941986 RepID=A0A8H9IU37_9PSEU|nr:hypothetical protein [Amycolatopsis bartoniae]MBB2935633.1 hypothetical protein [Amycolatopsis bartoniae]GHF60757.1 hypothetical protein GCM10017566_37620 [Amycolatopsis bartoniae]
MSMTADRPCLASTAAEELAAAVAAALRPDDAPLDHDPCRRGVGAAVERLGAALRDLITELTPKSTSLSDTAVARAADLAADIRFVRPTDF